MQRHLVNAAGIGTGDDIGDALQWTIFLPGLGSWSIVSTLLWVHSPI
jgi:hypothetical protein